MSKRIRILTFIAVGVLWGLSEIFLGDVFYRFHIPMRAATLTAIGITIMVAGRLISDMQWISPSGAPAPTAAWFMIRAVSTQQFTADGWGAIMMALRALSAIKTLFITVEVGLVLGVRAAMIPIGQAIL